MSGTFYESIKDEDVRSTADNIAEMKKWDKDLAAVAIAAGYGRVSSMKQAMEETSAEDQKKRIQNYCDKEGWQLYEF